MAERLFGTETEYALVIKDARGRRLDPGVAAGMVLQHARHRLLHLPDLGSAGMFLQNGARFYIDCGHHPEFSTPECANPWDIARYVKAGEEILLDLAEYLTGTDSELREVCFYRQNIDYSGSENTWGSHESYLHRTEPARLKEYLLPHLISRLIYTGAGGFDAQYPGIRFLLSPRVAHLQSEVSQASTHSRGIFHTKDESLSSAGYHRLHLLCSESLFSELALFLRFGVTALLVALIEAGVHPGNEVQLAMPLWSMKAFAADPSCKVAGAGAGSCRLTAASIQRHYLELAERHLSADFMPPWAEEVCREWRRVLDMIESGSPESNSFSLDWAIRYALFTQFIGSRGYDWDKIHKWNVVAEALLALARETKKKQVSWTVVWNEKELGNLVGQALPQDFWLSVTKSGFAEFRELREQLFELDTHFGQLGSRGLFSQMAGAGVLQHSVRGVDNIQHAVGCPPAIGRARLRGECVRRFASDPETRRHYACDWSGVWNQKSKKVLMLDNPFATEEHWNGIAGSRAMFSGLGPGLAQLVESAA